MAMIDVMVSTFPWGDRHLVQQNGQSLGEDGSSGEGAKNDVETESSVPVCEKDLFSRLTGKNAL
jgi:hypothetical protein